MTDTSRMDRRLRVVLFADVVGYTHLSSHDERTAIGIAETLRKIADEAVVKRDGRVVKHLGDGLMAVFDGARHGAEAAMEMGRAFEIATSGLPGAPHRLRLGLHMGEITETESGDIFGDAVNRASRIQSEAEPGDVFVSEAMTGLLRQDRRFVFEDRGERELKGIAEPVRVFKVHRADEQPAAAASATPAASTAPVSASTPPPSASAHTDGASAAARSAAEGAPAAPPATSPTDRPAASPHPLRDRRVRRWALAMGTTVGLAAFSFLIVGTGAFSSFGSPDGAIIDGGVLETPQEANGPTTPPTDGPDDAAELDPTTERSNPSEPLQPQSTRPQPAQTEPAQPTNAAGDSSEDVANEQQAGAPEESVPEAAPLTEAEVAELYARLFSDPQEVVNQLGLEAPTDEREEMLRITALIVAGHAGLALERLREIEGRPAFAMRVPAVTRAYFHFRAGDLRGAERIVSARGAVGANQQLDAVILRARIMGASGDPEGAFELLGQVPGRIQDEVWRGWRSYFELRVGTDEPGGAFLRSLGGRRSGDSAARKYVDALLMHQLRGGVFARGVIDEGRKNQWQEFLWVDIDPEWGVR